MVGSVGVASEPVKLILDTDMSGDCDDAGAMALLLALADRGECELLAIPVNRADHTKASAAAVDAIATYYGRPNIPIGTDKKGPTALQRTSAYAPALRDGFPNDVGPDDQAPDALDVYRKALSTQPDGSVTICSVGALSNLAELLRREPALVRAKVRRLVVMAGEFPPSKKPETNLFTHLEASRYVADHWPGEIVWHGFEVGEALFTGSRLKETPASNPVRRAYELKPYGKRPAIEGGQPSYDQAAALFAVRGPQPEFWRVVADGRARVDEAGLTHWEPDPNSRHSYVKITGEPAKLAAEIEALMIAPPKGLTPNATQAGPLPNTQALTEDGDLATRMVAGIHTYLDRELAASVQKRKAMWRVDASSVEAYRKSVEPNRARLRKSLGVVDQRVPASVEYVGGPDQPALIAEAATYKVYAIRWAVLPGVDGEGLLLEPKGKALADVVALPDADCTPEMAVGLAPGVSPSAQFPRRLAENGLRVIVPMLINRNDTFSANPRLNRATNQPHREFIHRMAYEMGRTLIGYEVQEVLAAVDWFRRDEDHPPTGVFGYGEGGLIAFYAAAVDERIDAGVVSGSFGPRERIAEEPIYHDVWGLLTEFGDGDVLRLIAPRSMVFVASPFTAPAGPPARPGKNGAAPGKSQAASLEAVRNEAATVLREFAGAAALQGVEFPVEKSAGADDPASEDAYAKFFTMLGVQAKPAAPGTPPIDSRKSFDPVPRQKRRFDQLVAFTQKLWRDGEAARKAFWARVDASSPASWEASCEWYRDYFHTEAIGKLPEPTMPLNPRTRQVHDEATWTGHDVVIDVYPDVFASGILLLPKDLKPGEKRPVIVTQHGLEGRPRDTIDPEKKTSYDEFSRKLVEQGYIVYAPQNPYRGETVFRQLQRKGHPLKLSLFSFIIRQHQRTIDWLETLPNVDPGRIAFYGLSYGGKTAMRVPAVEKRYCLSICSGDFNEWIGKNVSVDLDRSYMWTREYDMIEFDLGNTFNYAEMAYLIAPRPFMVERGHDDGVGTDEMVSYEYAKVRYLYANRLKIPDRTEIEYQPGGHRIYSQGTFAFLRRRLGWSRE